MRGDPPRASDISAACWPKDPHMIRFILSKLLYLVPTFLGITLIAFSFVRILPGDPIFRRRGMSVPICQTCQSRDKE